MIYINIFENTLKYLGLGIPEPEFYKILIYFIDEEFYNV